MRSIIVKSVLALGLLLCAGSLSLAQEAGHPVTNNLPQGSVNVDHNSPGGAAGQTAGDAAHGHGTEHSAELLRGGKEGLITALTTLIVFLLLVVVLGKFAWGPISGGLKAREDKIRKDIQDAEAARARAEATLSQYNQQLAAAEERVRQMLAGASADGERLATSIRMKAQTEAEEIKERATRDIEAARDSALREVYERTADLATTVAEKIIRRNLNAQDQQDLVRESLDQLQTVR